MAYTARDRLDQVYLLAAIWTETLLYGFYLCLFILAMYVMAKPSASRNAPMASRVFFVAIVLMFVDATFHEFIAMYRLIRAYGYVIGPEGTPISYYHQGVGWDALANTTLMGTMIWLGDALVIYRCYIIWGRNLYVIMVPLLVFLATIGVRTTLYVWYKHQFTTYDKILPVIDASYPLNFAQNLITTGLIIWKIMIQHRQSQASNLQVTNRVSLVTVMRIIFESALPYTLETLLLIILYFADHPLQFVVQAMIVPSIGIVFVLIAIRVHIARSQSSQNVTSSIIPPWLTASDAVFRPATLPEDMESSGTSRNDYDLRILGPSTRKSESGVYVHQETSVHESSSRMDDKDKPLSDMV